MKQEYVIYYYNSFYGWEIISWGDERAARTMTGTNVSVLMIPPIGWDCE